MIAKSLGVALVTGAAQGIGKAIAMRLASDGFKVALNDLNSKKEQLEAVARDIEKQGQASFVVPADVSQEREVHEMVQSASKTLGGLDVMVANAGITSPMRSITEFDIDDWDRILRVNARGVFLCYKHASKEMISRKQGGRIIGASSILVRGLTQSAVFELLNSVNMASPSMHMHLVLGPRKTLRGMTTDSLSHHTGVIDTPMLQQGKDENPGETFASLGQPGQPEDIASIVSYLASKESRYITGQTISVNGGIYFD
ncbi:hypothetical protein BDP27DRAFT_1413714 [Rhodocollybia butyracea]|uniref:NAD(P)-binding protein n=1 Tax=Rhodocollybia butyracea TaxID=206335 RepID=A0A9P5Q849_9AGAR|nr:hypothetical protein BDP27DRAFT_1413714 [Rhodocollybia butyracea]